MTQPARSPAAASANRAWLRALDRTARLDLASDQLLAHAVEAFAQTRPEAPALIGEAETLTYGDLAVRARRYGRWALAQGLAPGEVVALIAPNSPDYLACWLGLTRLGVVVALINTNLRGEALGHCLAVAAPGHVIAHQSLAPAAFEALAAAAVVPRVWVRGPGGDLDPVLAGLDHRPLADHEIRPVVLGDLALLIYTSGTTGLPKAARVSHHRVMSWSLWFAGLMGAGADDRLYDCLPMYHSTGGVVATGALLVSGGSVVLRERFSASRFWDDIAATGCTMAQYIGELCRYLLAAPPGPAEAAHGLRLACGNGLSGDCWTTFKDRFNIPQILEFYASTEGNFSLFNVEGEPGAIGRVPGFMAHRFPAALVRFDPAAGVPARGGDGLCRPCERGEVGEAIGRIGPGGAQRFEGYTRAADSEAKILRDVFAPGDAWLRTGDLMRQDARGFWYFVDRIGDTFRWKGENVATTEVAQVLSQAPGVAQACVFGVAVPGCDGKAGMAAIVPAEGLGLEELSAWLAERLPAYARPVFLRLVPDLALTETFKQKKSVLAAEGFDPAVISDRLFVATGEGGYAPLDADRFQAVIEGRVRL